MDAAKLEEEEGGNWQSQPSASHRVRLLGGGGKIEGSLNS